MYACVCMYILVRDLSTVRAGLCSCYNNLEKKDGVPFVSITIKIICMGLRHLRNCGPLFINPPRYLLTFITPPRHLLISTNIL